MRALLNGNVALEADVGWSYTLGSLPHVEQVLLTEDVAEALLAAAEPEGADLVLEVPGRGTEVIERLSIVGKRPSDVPGRVFLLVADRRWWWSRIPFRRSYNVPQRSGDLERLADGGLPLAVAPVRDDLIYAPWSLKDGVAAWRPDEAVRDVLDAVAGDWRVGGGDPLGGLQPIQEVEPSTTGSAAIDQVLGYFGPVLATWIDSTGEAVLEDLAADVDRRTSDATRERGAPAAGGADTSHVGRIEGIELRTLQDQSGVRPSGMAIHFQVGAEIRADAEESADGTHPEADDTTQESGEADAQPARLEWIVLLPEDATINGVLRVAGSYVSLLDYVTFLESEPIPIVGNFPFTIQNIRKRWMIPWMESYALPIDPRANIWAARSAAIRGSYRIRMRLREPYRSRVRLLQPYRVKILDPETGGRGPATVYTDFCRYLGYKWLSESIDQVDQVKPIQNVYAAGSNGPGNIIGTAIEQLQPANAFLEIEDDDLKIMRLKFVEDFDRSTQKLIPSAVVEATAPSDDPEAKIQWIDFARLTPTHELSVVLTCQPATPNSIKGLYTRRVTPGEVGVSAPARGPEQSIFVSPTRDIARFMWDDERADEIHAWWLANPPDTAPPIEDAYGDPINKSRTDALALAIAKSAYQTYRDLVVGTDAVPFSPGLRPQGNSEVRHQISPREPGAISVRSLPENVPQVDPTSLLPASVRAVTERLVQP